MSRTSLGLTTDPPRHHACSAEHHTNTLNTGRAWAGWTLIKLGSCFSRWHHYIGLVEETWRKRKTGTGGAPDIESVFHRLPPLFESHVLAAHVDENDQRPRGSPCRREYFVLGSKRHQLTFLTRSLNPTKTSLHANSFTLRTFKAGWRLGVPCGSCSIQVCTVTVDGKGKQRSGR